METLVLYFNELCLVAGNEALHEEAGWAEGTAAFAKAIERAFALRSDAQIAFSPGTWNADCGGRPFSSRLREHLIKDRYGLLLKRSLQLSDSDLPLEQEVRFGGRPSLGLTLAYLEVDEWGYGWALSIGGQGSPWDTHSLSLDLYVLTDTGDLLGPNACELGNLSRIAHVEHWRSELMDWGAVVATSCQLDEIAGHPVVMYPAPREHGPPHVHMLDSRTSRQTLAKYRIDIFGRPKGPPDWDAEMKEWITTYREQLLRSWDRCQRGKRPLALE